MSNTSASEEEYTEKRKGRVPRVVSMRESRERGGNNAGVRQGLVGDCTCDEQARYGQSDDELHDG